MINVSAVRAIQAGFSSVLLVALAAPSVTAQQRERLPVDPSMAVKEGFDTDRAIFWSRSNFTPLQDPEWQSLRDARRAGEVSDESTVVTFSMAGKTLVLVSRQMSYHHVAQGKMAGEPWMVTF